MNDFGYIPSFSCKILRFISKTIISLLRLNKSSRFSSEFSQLLTPYHVIDIPNAAIPKLYFLSNHGRLLWRAKTLLTEEPIILNWIKSFPSNSIYLDVGANLGSYVLLTKAFHPKIKIYAAELDFNNLYLMYHNLVKNNLQDDVIIFPFPLSQSVKISKVFYRDLSQGDALQSMDNPSPFNTKFTNNKHIFTHLSSDLDSLISNYSLRQPSHIKVDIDGNESQFMKGAQKTLKNAKEIYFEHSLTEQCNMFEDFLIDVGFSIFDKMAVFSGSNTGKIVGHNKIFKKKHCSVH